MVIILHRQVMIHLAHIVAAHQIVVDSNRYNATLVGLIVTFPLFLFGLYQLLLIRRLILDFSKGQ